MILCVVHAELERTVPSQARSTVQSAQLEHTMTKQARPHAAAVTLGTIALGLDSLHAKHAKLEHTKPRTGVHVHSLHVSPLTLFKTQPQTCWRFPLQRRNM